MQKEQIVKRLLEIASTSAVNLQEAQVKETIVEPLLRIAKDINAKGFTKTSQIELTDQGQASPAIDGGPVTPEQAAEISPGAAQAVNNQQQKVIDNTLQLSGPQAEIKLQITGPRDMNAEQFMQSLEQLPGKIQEVLPGYTIVVPSETANKIKIK